MNETRNELQTLIDNFVDEGILIGLQRKPDGQVNVIPFRMVGDKFFVCLVNALIQDREMRGWTRELVRNLMECLVLADEALKTRAHPDLN